MEDGSPEPSVSHVDGAGDMGTWIDNDRDNDGEKCSTPSPRGVER